MIKKLGIALLAVLALLVGGATAMNRLAPATTAQILRDVSRSAAGLQPGVVLVQGKPFPYLAGGAGPALVLVHGFTSNKDTFNPVARYLTPAFRIYAPDMPGYGDASRDPQADYSYDAQVENLHAFIQALSLGRVHLGGSSMGGGIVAAFAAKYPQEVASIWLIDAAATHEVGTSDLMRNYDATGEFPLLVRTEAQHATKLALLFGKPPFIPYAIEHSLASAAIRDFELHSKILKSMRNSVPLEARYAPLQTPALIVTGDQDRVIPPASAQTLARLFPNSVVKVMPGLGHIPMVEAPAQTAADYIAFRASLPPGR